MSTASATPDVRGVAALHDALGRFVKGNPGGPGNPHHRKVAGLREALLRIVTPEDVEAVARKLIDVAKGGSMQAIKLFLAYTIGKPGAKEFWNGSLWMGDNLAVPWMDEARAKVDASPVAGAAGPEGRGIANPSHAPEPPVQASMLEPEATALLNGGKRLTRQQRRALRRQAKRQPSANGPNGGSTPKLNGDNGWLVDATPAADPLAALARQRDLLK